MGVPKAIARMTLIVLVSRLSFNADNAVGERTLLMKSFPMARQANARRGSPSNAIKPRLGRINIQPGSCSDESLRKKRRKAACTYGTIGVKPHFFRMACSSAERT